MEKYYTNGHLCAVVMLLLLVCFATHAQCRAMDEDVFSENKLNLPPELPCTRGSAFVKCKTCWCCMLNDYCYDDLASCKNDCQKKTN